MNLDHSEPELQFKVVLLGDSQVGKTSLINRQLHGYQPPNPNPTIGCHCNEILMKVNDREIILQVWDTAGQEIYRALVPVYLRGAKAAIILYDITEAESFNSLSRWYEFLHGTVSDTTPTFLVANKIDLLSKTDNQNSQPYKQAIDNSTAQATAASYHSHFFKVSALTGANVDALFTSIAQELLKTNSEINSCEATLEVSDNKKCC